MCALPRMTHITRCMPPALTKEGVHHFDQMARRTILNKLQITDDELKSKPLVEVQLAAPMSNAGFGYRRLQSTMSIAYWC